MKTRSQPPKGDYSLASFAVNFFANGRCHIGIACQEGTEGQIVQNKGADRFLDKRQRRSRQHENIFGRGRSGDLADPRFPRKGCANPRGRGAKLLYGNIFAEHKKE